MRVPVVTWLARIAWALLPVLVGPAVADAVEGRSAAVGTVATVGGWAVWVVVLVAALVPSTVSLTLWRVVAPLAAVAAGAAAGAGAGALAAGVGIAGGLAAAIGPFTAETGQAFVQGSAYGDEDRLPLRVPGPLLLGPLWLTWAVTALVLPAGVLCLAAGLWVPGALLGVAGAAGAVWGGRVLHRLHRRWLVFVPAGVVLHDPVVLAETAMVPRDRVSGVALALAGTTASDLTGGALGRAVEVGLRETTAVAVRAARLGHTAGSIPVDAFLCSPTRPGAVLATAARRGLRVG